MEWYWVVAIIVAFFAVIGGRVYLFKRGIMSNKELNLIDSMVDVFDNVLEVIGNKEDSAFYSAAKLIIELVDRAVAVAENAWYHGEISREEREEYCMEELHSLLEGFEIELTEGQWNVIGRLIRAACEKLGHGVEIEEIASIEDVADALGVVQGVDVTEGMLGEEPDEIKVEE